MRKKILAVAVVLILLAGCSSGPPPDNQTTTSTPTPPTSPTTTETTTTTTTTEQSTTTTTREPSTQEKSRTYVVDVRANADGYDHDNLNDEYVVIEHQGPAVDVSGWTVSDSAGHSYTIPSGVTLSDGEQLTISTGSGSNTSSELYWGSDSAVWNNGGDTVVIVDDNGDTVVKYQYD